MSFKPNKGNSPKKTPEPKAIEGEILPPESPVNQSSGKSGPTYSATDHIDDAAAEIIEPGPEPASDTAGTGDAVSGTAAPGGGSSPGDPPVPPGALPFEVWYEEVFVRAHKEGGALLELQAPGMWVDRPLAPLAAEAFYRSCCRVPFLHFMLRPGPGWIGDAVLMGLYTVPLVMAIRAEVGYKMAQAAAQAAPPDAAGAESAADDPLSRAQNEA